jgi:hypothetical protein
MSSAYRRYLKASGVSLACADLHRSAAIAACAISGVKARIQGGSRAWPGGVRFCARFLHLGLGVPYSQSESGAQRHEGLKCILCPS